LYIEAQLVRANRETEKVEAVWSTQCGCRVLYSSGLYSSGQPGLRLRATLWPRVLAWSGPRQVLQTLPTIPRIVPKMPEVLVPRMLSPLSRLLVTPTGG
jgi:hypothetical protein